MVTRFFLAILLISISISIRSIAQCDTPTRLLIREEYNGVIDTSYIVEYFNSKMLLTKRVHYTVDSVVTETEFHEYNDAELCIARSSISPSGDTIDRTETIYDENGDAVAIVSVPICYYKEIDCNHDDYDRLKEIIQRDAATNTILVTKTTYVYGVKF